MAHNPGESSKGRPASARPFRSPAAPRTGSGRPGLPNAWQVADGLYRGARPEAAGCAELRRLGIRTAVNLRSMHSDRDERRQARLAGGASAYAQIPMHVWRPEREDVVRFLRIAADPARQPVFVHCQRGADRTGVVVAAWRMAVQGWSAERAIAG